MNNTRVIKSEEEIKCLKEICTISSEAHKHIMRNIKEGMFEYEIEAMFLAFIHQRGSQDTAYESIVGSGKDASILHYIDNNKQLKKEDFILCDMGAKKFNICSDITTTFPIGGKFT